jgi:GntR family transcriptional regulator
MHAMHRLQSLHEDDRLTSVSPEIEHRVIRWEPIPASPLHAAALGVTDGEIVVHYERLTSSLTPLIFWSTVMRSDVGLRPPAPVGACSALGFYAYLELSGLTLGQESVRTSAVRADRGVAELLDVEPGSPLLVQHRRLLLADGRPLEVSTGYLRPDQVALTHEISR